MPELAHPAALRPFAKRGSGQHNLVGLSESLLSPLVATITLWGVAFIYEGGLKAHYLVLSFVVFSLTFPGPARLHARPGKLACDLLLAWTAIAGLVLFLGYATGYVGRFEKRAIITWLWATPAFALVAHLGFRAVVPVLFSLAGGRKDCVIAGVNAQGLALAHSIERDPYTFLRVAGFFDDRSADRIEDHECFEILDTLTGLARYVRQNGIQTIYLALPMASQPRILELLDDLRDTTASIYFVPDIFVTDIIQGQLGSVDGMPVVAVCETPFTGMSGVIKRVSDVAFALVILALLSPLFATIAICIKRSSPGPIIFRQRRYGVDGREIIVYKFRSMTVTEDGGAIAQAQKNDARVTPLGAFLRKTSLDELPQFFNVLQGPMSIVGPRPHAVAHNELYRKVIKGYMVRHKVKPGITGWAQVNGYRGETDTLHKMKMRIEYDLDYLRKWSLRLDAYIIFRTVAVVFSDRNAY